MSKCIHGSPSSIAAARVSVDTTAVKLVDAREGRTKLLIKAGSSIFIGADNTVTTSTGFQCLSVQDPAYPNYLTLETSAEVWAIASSGGPYSVYVLELFD